MPDTLHVEPSDEDIDVVARQLQGWEYSTRYRGDWELRRGGELVGFVYRYVTRSDAGGASTEVVMWQPAWIDSIDSFGSYYGVRTLSLTEAMDEVEEKLADV